MKHNVKNNKDYALGCINDGTIYIRGDYETTPNGKGYSDKGMADFAFDLSDQFGRFCDGFNKLSDKEIMDNLPNIMRIMVNTQLYGTIFDGVSMSFIRDAGVTPFDFKPGERYANEFGEIEE